MTGRTAVVIGAGIGGPVAALALDRAGYSVTLHEQRHAGARTSPHVISLTEESEEVLGSFGITRSDLYRYERQQVVWEESAGRRLGSKSKRQAEAAGVAWSDLHRELVKRCDVTWGSRIETQPDADVVVWADGVGSRGRRIHSRREGSYSGEMLFRGLCPRKASDMDWLIMGDGLRGKWEMVSYPTWNASDAPVRGFTLFAHVSEEPWRRTETLSPEQRARLAAQFRESMHTKPHRLIRTATEITCAPQYVWPDVKRLTWTTGSRTDYLIGDAVGTVSPRTAMGANNAIREAAGIAAYTPARWDAVMTQVANEYLDESRYVIDQAGGGPFGAHG